MTDPTPTTDEQIALELGYKKLTAKQTKRYIMAYGVSSLWRDPKGDLCEGIPDFEHDKAYALTFLEEMVDAHLIAPNSYSIFKSWGRETYRCSVLLDAKWIDEVGDTLTEAISHAWLAWKKEG